MIRLALPKRGGKDGKRRGLKRAGNRRALEHRVIKKMVGLIWYKDAGCRQEKGSDWTQGKREKGKKKKRSPVD